MKLAVETFPIRNVPGDLRGADHSPRGIKDGRDRQRHVDERAVLPAADRVEVFDPLGVSNALEDQVLLAESIGLKQHPNRLADRLVSRISEQAFRAPVP